MRENEDKKTSLNNNRIQKYLVFLLFGLVVVALGVTLYAWSNLTTYYNIPKGAIDFSFGPRNNVTLVETEMLVSFSVPHDMIDLQVSFNFSDYNEYFINIVMPYETFQARPYLIYQHQIYFNETSQLGNISSNFKSFPTKKSSVINATFIPNEDFFFFPNEPITLSLEARVSGLASISYPLGSRQTMMLTFFGDQTGVWDDEMRPYIGANAFPMHNYPLRVFVRFPRDSYLSDTFPTPIELFVTERFRVTIFDLDFSYPSGHAQTISCSFASPQKQSYKDLLNFLSGIFLATGITLCIESIRTKRNESERKGEVKEEVRGVKQKEKQRDVIADLIEKVDDPVYGWKPLSKWKRLQLVFGKLVIVLIVVFYLMVIYYAVQLLLPFIGTPETLLVVVIGLVALILQFFQIIMELTKSEDGTKMIRVTTDWNYKRTKERVESEHWILLKALIRMRTIQKGFKLSEVRKKYPSLFNEEHLVSMLYD